jgi:tetratricopeptide (TPR) repeat protein
MEAVRKVQAHLSTFELPGQIRCSYAGATKQAGMLETHPVTDDNEFNVDVELRVAGRSGPVYARVPVPVRQGALLRPSVIFIDGQARMIAQSVFDDLRTMLTVDMSKQGQAQAASKEPGVGSTLEQAQAYDKAGDVPNACVMYNRYRFEMRDAGQPVDPQVVQRYRYLHALMMEGSPEKAEAFLSKSSVDMSKQRGQTARMSNKTAQSESEKLERLLDQGAAYEADNWPGVMIGKGLQALATDRYEEGIEFLTRAYAATHSANILLYLGQAYEKVGNVQKAVDAYTQYAASHPVEEAKIHEKIRSLTKTAQSEKPESAGPSGKPVASTMTLRTLYRSGDPGRAGGFWTPDIEYARYIAPQGPFFAADLDGALVHAQSGSPSSEGLAARALDGDLAVEYEAWDWPTTEVVVLDPSILQNLRRASTTPTP